MATDAVSWMTGIGSQKKHFRGIGSGVKGCGFKKSYILRQKKDSSVVYEPPIILYRQTLLQL